MSDSNEQFYNEFMVSLTEEFKDVDVLKVMARFSSVLKDYEINKRCTSLTVYEEIPNCVKTYLVVRKMDGTAMSSLGLYSLRLTQFFKFVGKRLEEITINDIRRTMYEIQSTTNCSDRTLSSTMSIVSTFFKWANAEGYIPSNPCVLIKPIKYARKERDYLSDIEMEQLRSACVSLRDKAMIEFFYSTGCRVSELARLNISDLDLKEGEVTLFGKGSKYRKSYLNAKAVLAIQNYLDSRTDTEPALFVSLRKPYKRLAKAAIEKVVKDLGVAAKLDKNLFPHLIRHTTATHALQRNMDITEIQRMLGHRNIETTLIYAKLADDTVKNSHKRCIV